MKIFQKLSEWFWLRKHSGPRGRDLLLAVRQQIADNPETFYYGWGYDTMFRSEFGPPVRACIGGWSLLLGLNFTTWEQVRKLSFPDSLPGYTSMAGKLLGLSPAVAYELFYSETMLPLGGKQNPEAALRLIDFLLERRPA